MNEIDKFFGDLPSEDKKPQDFSPEKKPEEETKPEEGEEKDEEQPHKNRAYRRLEERYQKERESNIALAARLQAESEAKQRETPRGPSDAPAEWVALYGDTPEAQKAWKMQETLLARVAENAKDAALTEFEARNTRAQEEQKGFEEFIDLELESLEDNFNVDLTSNAPSARKARREFLEMVQNLSPKDENGTITGYADFGATFEQYQKLKAQETPDETSARRKEIASRSMKKAGTGENTVPQITPGFRGWEKDYNLNG